MSLPKPTSQENMVPGVSALVDALESRLKTVYAVVAAAELYSSGSYGNPSTVGPSLTLPADGNYLLLFGAKMTTTGTLADILSASPSIAGATPLDANAAVAAFPGSGGATVGSSVSGAVLLTGRSAGDVILLQYKRVNNGITVANRWLLAIPI